MHIYMNYRLLWCINLVIFFSTNYEANTSGANANTNSAATQARTNFWENSNYIAHSENLNPEIAILNELLIQNRTTPLYLDDVMTFEVLRYSDLLHLTQSNTHSQIITYNRQNRQIQISSKYISFDDIQKLVTDYYQIFLLKYGLQNAELSALLTTVKTKIDEIQPNNSDILNDALDLETIIDSCNDPIRSCILSSKNIYAFICYAYSIYSLHLSSRGTQEEQDLINYFRAETDIVFFEKINNLISLNLDQCIQNILESSSFEEYLQKKNRDQQDRIIIRDQIAKGIIEKVINDMKLYYDNLFAHECSILRKFIKRSITS